MTGASNDGGEDGPWGIVSGETSLENKRSYQDYVSRKEKKKKPTILVQKDHIKQIQVIKNSFWSLFQKFSIKT